MYTIVVRVVFFFFFGPIEFNALNNFAFASTSVLRTLVSVNMYICVWVCVWERKMNWWFIWTFHYYHCLSSSSSFCATLNSTLTTVRLWQDQWYFYLFICIIILSLMVQRYVWSFLLRHTYTKHLSILGKLVFHFVCLLLVCYCFCLQYNWC